MSCAVAVAVGSAACGDDDTKTGAGDSAPATAADSERADASRTTAQEPASDEGQIRALVADVEKAFKTGDGQVICGSLTETGQRDMVAYGKVMRLPGSCADVAVGIVKNNRALKNEQPPTRVVNVRVRGSQAIALLRIGGKVSLPQRYRKVDGKWKIRTYGLAAAVGSQ
jgi:hypothetical protein